MKVASVKLIASSTPQHAEKDPPAKRIGQNRVAAWPSDQA